MPTVLVSGAANGLGAAFVQAYQQDSSNIIIAIDLQHVQHRENVTAYVVDVSSQTSIDRFIFNIKGMPVDLFIHSAGIRGLVPARELQNPGDAVACESVDAMDYATMTQTFNINAVGTFMLLKALLPNLHMGTGGQGGKAIVMTSRMGSIGNNEHPIRAAGGAYAYRASKAAVNAIVRSFAADVPAVSFILCHPGRVETKLVQWKEEGAISAQESVISLMPLIEQWGRADSGKFYDRFGESIRW